MQLKLLFSNMILSESVVLTMIRTTSSSRHTSFVCASAFRRVSGVAGIPFSKSSNLRLAWYSHVIPCWECAYTVLITYHYVIHLLFCIILHKKKIVTSIKCHWYILRPVRDNWKRIIITVTLSLPWENVKFEWYPLFRCIRMQSKKKRRAMP